MFKLQKKELNSFTRQAKTHKFLVNYKSVTKWNVIIFSFLCLVMPYFTVSFLEVYFTKNKNSVCVQNYTKIFTLKLNVLST